MATTNSPICLVVCDAGPIIHLDEIGYLHLLKYFDQVLIPSVVWDEVEHHRPHALTASGYFQRTSTESPRPPAIDSAIRLFSLHAGEIQALHIAHEHTADLLLTDDTAARLAAKSNDITVSGTLGILLRALRKQHLSKQETLNALNMIPTTSTLHIKHSLLNQVIKDVESYSAQS